VTARAESIQGTSQLVAIDEQSAIGGARRMAVALGGAYGLSEDALGRLAIVVTEAATNIMRHAGNGTIILRAVMLGDSAGVEMLAIDKGPGIIDVARAMRDGFSTSGTAGQGLGGIRRLSQTFEIHTQRSVGTVLLARIGEPLPAGTERTASLDDRLGVICVAIRGENESGDAWRIVEGRHRTTVMVVDGLGHGPQAAAAAAIATDLFPSLADAQTTVLIDALDEGMRASRGAALSVAAIDDATRTVSFSGVGNVDGRVLADGKSSHFLPQNGIIGNAKPTARATEAPWPTGARLVMHSDGISARWHMDAYPGLQQAHPAILAGVIFRDFARERDDATVLVLADRLGEKGN
jgi:anti-sigma regulatory factor (Ser/Thr protein kinase)